jgi:DNA-binding NtrC family response regulator
MEGVTLDGQRSVLIVDQSEETREVLRTALERRGLRTYATGRARRGLELARHHRPGVIVLDLDLDDCGPESLSARFAGQSPGQPTYLVMLGSLRRDGLPVPDGEFVPKPYHYGSLIRRIEELAGAAPQTVARSA